MAGGASLTGRPEDRGCGQPQFKGQIQVTRKIDIDRLLRLNSDQRIPSIRKHFATRSDPASQDAIYGDIKSVLENLRSVLDYAFQDIAELLGRGRGEDLHFPFAHPESRNGVSKSHAAVVNEFKQRLLVREIERDHPRIFNALEAVQGARWLSELIATVNPQKHDRPDRLGPRYIQSRYGNVTIHEGARLELGPGARLIDDAPVIGPLTLTPGVPLVGQLASFSLVESIDAPDFEARWIDRLESWNSQIASLIGAIYLAFP
jgi:hypothetical protein